MQWERANENIYESCNLNILNENLAMNPLKTETEQFSPKNENFGVKHFQNSSNQVNL